MSNFGGLIQEYYVDKFRQNAQLRKEKLSQLKTPEDVYAYIAGLRQKIKKAYSFPEEKCPLNVQHCGTIKGDGYRLEKLIYYSRPDFPVTANLYVPDNAVPGKTPALIHVLGHALYGKASKEYQTVGISFCKKGYMVLMPDPIGQGERFSFPALTGFQNVREHNLLNRRLLSIGDNFGAWRIWDAIRGVDLLLEREETDPERVGVTGNSGGGTMTTLLNAVEPRLKVAAPNCYITSWLRLVENELPVDGEQIVPGFAADGGEMADLLILKAPNPLLIMGEKDDFFDIRGTRESYEDVRKIYTILGYPERVRLYVGDLDHGYQYGARRAAYGFFNEFFNVDSDDTEPEVQLRTHEEIACTPECTITKLPGAITADQAVQAKVREYAAKRPARSKEEIKKLLAETLKLEIPAQAPTYRQLRPKYGTELHDSRFGIETEPNLITTLHLLNASYYMHLPSGKSAELYIPHQKSVEEMKERSPKADTLRFGFDYRGVGESNPKGCDQGAWVDAEAFFGLYRRDYHYDAMARLMGFSVLGKRTEDVMKAILLLKEAGIEEITLTASGIGFYPAILAALFSPVKVKTAFENRCRTFLDSSLSGTDNIPQSMTPFNILGIADFDELQALAEE